MNECKNIIRAEPHKYLFNLDSKFPQVFVTLRGPDPFIHYPISGGGELEKWLSTAFRS